MLIEIIDVSQETKTSAKGTPYQQMSVTFRNKTYQNKTETKTLLPFGVQKDSFDILAQATKGDMYNVGVEKNSKGYNDWVTCVPSTGEATQSSAPASTGQASGGARTYSGGGRDFETKEERTNKQRYIVRQSSIDYAIKTLTPGAKGALDSNAILELASQYEGWVFRTETAAPESLIAGIEDAGSLEDMDDDIPF